MWRQLGRRLSLLLVLGLSACGGSEFEEGQVGFIEGFFGGIIVDEPRAALIGRDVLSAGGSASDAAVAAYFTMAVTMPGGASLGGGGICLVHDRLSKRVEAVDFLARVPAGGGANATVAVPGNIRGMAFVQARFGRLNWADLLIPAENFARNGHPTSRAFVRDLSTATVTLRGDPEARRIFGLDRGEATEGRVIEQIELAAVLSVIRTRGSGEFYNGRLGRQFAEAVRQTGAAMTAEDLRQFRARLLQPLQFELGNDLLYFSPGPLDGGMITAQLWAAGYDDDRYDDADTGERLHLLAELASRAYAARKGATADGSASADPFSDSAIATLVAGYDGRRHQPVADDTAAIVDYSARGRHDGASIVAADARGQAIACSFSLNRPFGTGQLAPGTGILLAAPETGERAALPSAVLLANPTNQQVFFAAAISGGSPATLAAVALETLDSGRDLGVAITRPRAYNTGRPDIMIAEPRLSQPAQDFLKNAGYTLQMQERLGRVNGFRCPAGLPREPICQFVAEPRGHGLAVSADEE